MMDGNGDVRQDESCNDPAKQVEQRCMRREIEPEKQKDDHRCDRSDNATE
ncbi:uncharacterized protein Nmag_3315 [Natrialba magadii ATCC 43099]|uniref:Uncharacterized protein n=1 Tax=Natrialba magadii (strain ATCC 43099 / DSM 3394 / CCM 3739 / CIP 104546 / IAM 13178 / JCM 8861 / NBRC 102185 / NCIMB 2190 / MS3) TaxID=547559 RepID=D3SSM0_NATMM|nr:uncharacterized protein Nmag_3315 [Natrialba magadii ATCC 43099]